MRVLAPAKRIPSGADRTSAIRAPKAATKIVDIEVRASSPHSIATRLLKKREIKTKNGITTATNAKIASVVITAKRIQTLLISEFLVE